MHILKKEKQTKIRQTFHEKLKTLFNWNCYRKITLILYVLSNIQQHLANLLYFEVNAYDNIKTSLNM